VARVEEPTNRRAAHARTPEGAQSQEREDEVNIKEHIEAGHYPKDEKGRALVVTDGGHTFCIVRTDNPGPRPLVGMRISRSSGRWDGWQDWTEEGDALSFEYGIRPPLPRKVKVTAWAIVWPPSGNDFPNTIFGVRDSREDAEMVARNADPRLVVVPLTGEYEEAWT
jgi:hypothetical protein